MSNNKPFFCTAYCSKYVRWRSRQFGTSAEVSARQFGTGADLSGHFAHFGTNLMVPKCLGSEVSWVRSVLTPVLVLIEGKDYFNNILKHSGDSAQVWWVNIHNIHNAFHNHTNKKTAETVKQLSFVYKRHSRKNIKYFLQKKQLPLTFRQQTEIKKPRNPIYRQFELVDVF